MEPSDLTRFLRILQLPTITTVLTKGTESEMTAFAEGIVTKLQIENSSIKLVDQLSQAPL